MFLYSIMCENAILPPKKEQKKAAETVFSTDPATFLYSSASASLASKSAYSFKGTPLWPSTFTNFISI